MLLINKHVPHHVTTRYIKCGLWSMLLFIINWASILIAGWFTFRFVKKLNTVKSIQYQNNLKNLLKSEQQIYDSDNKGSGNVNIVLSEIKCNKNEKKRHSVMVKPKQKTSIHSISTNKHYKNMLSQPLLENGIIKNDNNNFKISFDENYVNKNKKSSFDVGSIHSSISNVNGNNNNIINNNGNVKKRSDSVAITINETPPITEPNLIKQQSEHVISSKSFKKDNII